MCAFVCRCGIFLCTRLLIFLSYLEHIKLSPLIRLPNREHVDQVGLCSVHFKHPALDLNVRREKVYYFGRKKREENIFFGRKKSLIVFFVKKMFAHQKKQKKKVKNQLMHVL